MSKKVIKKLTGWINCAAVPCACAKIIELVPSTYAQGFSGQAGPQTEMIF